MISDATINIEPAVIELDLGPASSALGQKRTCAVQLGMSALPSRADSGAGYISMRSVNVGSSPAAFELFIFRDTGYICSDL